MNYGPIILSKMIILRFNLQSLNLTNVILSLGGTPIECNCDDEKTGLTDDNVLRSMDQLPVTGTVIISVTETDKLTVFILKDRKVKKSPLVAFCKQGS